ncbi:hypothetical protein TRFO_03848 [Tritrichomonas foetus]|uniref:Uncharacterized protein n=1 Tax=Tritrichomonas foetus TaxID=1144522 RepID=A0A1J4KQD3_9EUKA|nr:hypothetical protein TRFO_03848 [Tritrichomonas foetus]|eukprot:OHT11645.1 hypothetical protein TRFO_03848 [Tritrichomonas foetus]
MQDQENRDNSNRYSSELEKVKSAEHDALVAAGNYFHTFFPSIKSLQQHCESNPIIDRVITFSPSKPFTPTKADVVHHNDVKKMKKQCCKIQCLKSKIDDIQQSLTCSEAMNRALSKDNDCLKREIAQLRISQANTQNKLDETCCMKIELEKSKRKIKDLESVIQRNMIQMTEKEENFRNELAQVQQQVEIEAEKGKQVVELKSQLCDQKMIIENQRSEAKGDKDKLNHLTDLQSQQVVKIAQLESENTEKLNKIKELKAQIKSLSKVPVQVEVQPVIHWDQVSSPEIPKELQVSLADVIENNLMPIEAKIKNTLKTICAYYSAHQQHLESFRSKYQNKLQKQQKSMNSMMSEIGKIILNRAVDYEEIYSSHDLQVDIVNGIKKYVSTIADLESKIRLQQISFPYDKLSSLQEDTKSKSVEIDEIKSQNKRLKKEIMKRQVSLSFFTNEVFTCDSDSKALHENIKVQKSQINEYENQLKVAKDGKITAEKKLGEVKKLYNDTQSKLFGAQKEIERMKRIITEKETQITDLNTQYRNRTIDDLSTKVHQADDERDFLMNELRNIKNENYSKTEYENTINTLKTRVRLLEQELEDVKNGNSNYNQLKDQLREVEHERDITQNEISILREQNAVVPDKIPSLENKQMEIIDKLKDKLEKSEKRAAKLERRLQKVQELLPQSAKANLQSVQKIKDLEARIAALQKQIEEERKAFIKQIKEAKMDSIKEYQNLVDQLQKRCTNQKNTIETLSNELKAAKKSIY